MKIGTYSQIDFEDAPHKGRFADTTLKKCEYKSVRCRNTKPDVSDQHNPKSVANERDTDERKGKCALRAGGEGFFYS